MSSDKDQAPKEHQQESKNENMDTSMQQKKSLQDNIAIMDTSPNPLSNRVESIRIEDQWLFTSREDLQHLIPCEQEPLKPRCKVCGRVLKGRNAIKRGMGKTCERKQAARQTIDIGESDLWEEVYSLFYDNAVNQVLGEDIIKHLIQNYKITKR